MRLKHLHILGEYKNLKDFKLDFDGASFIDVFVGKNGTGKSNLFEAIIEIFKHFFDHEYPIIFDYKFQYELNGDEVLIFWKKGKWLDRDEQEIAFVSKQKLPSNLLIYYSGHNDTIGDFIEDFNRVHRNKINDNRKSTHFKIDDARLFFGIGKEYKNILLATTLLQSDDLHLKQIIKQKLGIAAVGTEIKMVFQKPFFASKEDTFDEFDADARFWGAEGYFRTILNEIWDVDKIANTPVRNEGRIVKGDSEEYILYRSFEDFKNKFAAKSIFEVFITFDNLKTIGLLREIDIEVTLNSGKKISLGKFSDGQFQSVYILSITEIFKEHNCISLLDEPDAFLHPEWQFDFFDQLRNISSASGESNHLLISSHSAITLIKFIKDKVNYFELHDTKGLISNKIPKKIAVNKLSKNIIKLHEQEQLLSIINTIQIENKPVLFTEGKTDPLILKEAYNRLFPDEEIPFIPFYCFGHKSVAQIMRDQDIQNDMNGLPMFGLFDFDKAFNTFNGFNDDFLIEDHSTGFVKQLAGKEVYVMMLPVPENGIKKQVINLTTNQCYNDRSVMTIEHLFFDYVDAANFNEDTSMPGNPERFVGDKVNFAKNIVPGLNNEAFEIFRPMFEFIKSKIPNP